MNSLELDLSYTDSVTKLENEVLKLVDSFRDTPTQVTHWIDQRWLSIARADIEKGFMALRRAMYGGLRVSDFVKKVDKDE